MNARSSIVFISALLALNLASPSESAIPAPKSPLNEQERYSLRYRLENLWNEVDLLVRNESSDRADIRKQEKDFEVHEIFKRIPFQEDLKGLRKQLSESAASQGFEIHGLRVLSRSQAGKPLPSELYTDRKSFRIEDAQLAQEIRFELRGNGHPIQVEAWSKTLSETLLRLVKPDRFQALPKGKWRLEARTFRFREIRFPRLRPREPEALLPSWAKADPKRFAASEPLLWDFVTRIRHQIPKTRQAYEQKRAFLLNSARMRYYLRASNMEGAPSR